MKTSKFRDEIFRYLHRCRNWGFKLRATEWQCCKSDIRKGSAGPQSFLSCLWVSDLSVFLPRSRTSTEAALCFPKSIRRSYSFHFTMNLEESGALNSPTEELTALPANTKVVCSPALTPGGQEHQPAGIYLQVAVPQSWHDFKSPAFVLLIKQYRFLF